MLHNTPKHYTANDSKPCITLQILLKPWLTSQWNNIKKTPLWNCDIFAKIFNYDSFLYVAYFVGTSRSCGLVWIFRKKLGETTFLLLMKLSDILGKLKFFHSLGHHLAVHLQSTCLVRLPHKFLSNFTDGGQKRLFWRRMAFNPSSTFTTGTSLAWISYIVP